MKLIQAKDFHLRCDVFLIMERMEMIGAPILGPKTVTRSNISQ